MILILSIQFSKKQCEESSPPTTQIKPTKIETHNSDIENNSTNEPNDDPKIDEKSPTKLKQLEDRITPEKKVESSKKESPKKCTDKSPKHHNKTSKTDYDPTKKNYDPIQDAIWDHGQP